MIEIPQTMLVWPLYGAGIENLGENGQPVRWPVPRPAPDQILIRSDAVGLCYSDVKILRQGGDHPRLYRRDLRIHPIVQGHEVSLTVVEVGEAWRDRFHPGQRLALQADIYYRGLNLAYGYVFYGGLAQYGLLGPAALAGDEGCYAITVPDDLGYAEVALTEPWACVEAAYSPRRRLYVKPSGTMWILGRPGLEISFDPGRIFVHGQPSKIVLTDVPMSLRDALRGIEVAIHDGVAPSEYAALVRAETESGFDDIVVLDPTPAVLDGCSSAAAIGATIALIGQQLLGGPVQVDVGRVHYDYITYLGTRGHDIGAAYGPARNRSEVRRGGRAWIVGGGGPMGRMHLQRMLEMPDGPRTIVVAETNALRKAELANSFADLAQANDIELVLLNPNEVTPQTFDEALRSVHGGQGFDDIVVIVASAPAIEAAMPHLALDGMLVVFGGLARGTTALLDLSNVYMGGAQITGSAGSTIGDQVAVIRKVAAGHLSTASAVAAVGGLDSARDGIQCLVDRCFAGKVVIYPQVTSFPVTGLADLQRVAPTVYARLSPSGGWTREAEAEFLRLYASGTYGV
jgi:threonine dehydrogenase-like Zn-dependent dehydrogenase